MKRLLLILLTALTIWPLAVSVAFAALSLPPKKAQTGKPDKTYDNATLTEDVTWKGSVLIRGYLVVSPQATLRIEPGTAIRFAKVDSGLRKPRLVVMGRIQSIGTAGNPIHFSSDAAISTRGDWGGILLLATEKRNQFEHSIVEGADTGVETGFSSFSAKSLRIALANIGLMMRDSVATIESSSIFACDIAAEIHDSESELRDSVVSNNRCGLMIYRSSLAMSSTGITENEQQGIFAEECRIRFNTCDISGNSVGAFLKGGEGLVFMTRFKRNKDTALHLVAARLKINRSLFADNFREGLRVEQGKALIWGCAFSGNGGFNLYNAGTEEISAVQNWWDNIDENAIMAKIYDASRESRSGMVQIFPWLLELPAVMP